MARVFLLVVLAGCAAEERPRITLQLVARDGENPLEGARRMRLELDAEPATAPEPREIDPSGFAVDVDLPEVDVLRRVRVVLEDADEAVVSRGATPEAQLELLAGVPMRLLLSRAGAAGAVTIEAMRELGSATTLGDEWIVGLDPDGELEMLDLLALMPVSGLAPLDPPRPGATLADLGDRRTLLVGGGEGALVYDGNTNVWSTVGDGIADGAFAQPALLPLAAGGAIAACGGRREVVAFGAGGEVSWTAELAAPRTACAAAIAGEALLVYGGGDDGAPAAEAVDLEDHEPRVLVDAPDPRGGAAAAAVGDRFLVTAGTRDGQPLADAIWIDPGCLDGCPEPVTLEQSRASAVAIGLDATRALVGGGGEPFEIVARDGSGATVPGPGVDAHGLLLAGTSDVWWWGPDGPGVYAD